MRICCIQLDYGCLKSVSRKVETSWPVLVRAILGLSMPSQNNHSMELKYMYSSLPVRNNIHI